MAFRPYTTIGNRAYPKWKFSVGASTTITRGDLLMLSSGNAVIHDGSGAAAIGVADESVTTGAGEADTVLVTLGEPWVIFEADSSGASTIAKIGYLADVSGSTGSMVVDPTSSTDDTVVIMGYSPRESGWGTDVDLLVKIADYAF